MDDQITIRGAREHNLRGVDVDIPRDQFVVITGLSGSGKSSLAFDTIYAEGQRRYMESLSSYARQFLGVMERPDVDLIDGLSPVIAIEQKTVNRNPRSTVGTVTEVYDFLRLLYARAADAYSYKSGAPMRRQSDDEIIDAIAAWPEGTRVILLAPVVRGRKGHYRDLFEQIAKQGFERVRTDGEIRPIEKGMQLDRYSIHDIEVVIDRIAIKEGIRPRIAQAVEIALGMGGGTLVAQVDRVGEGPVGSAKSPVENDTPEASGEEQGKGKKGAKSKRASGARGNEASAPPPEAGDVLFSRHLTAPQDGLSYEDPSPNTFSFNSPYGACPACNGLGVRKEIDPDLVVPNPKKSLQEGAVAALGTPRDVWVWSQVRAVADAYEFDLETPIADLTERQRQVLMEGAGDEQFDIVYKYKGREVKYQHRFGGVLGHIAHTQENASSKGQKKWAEAFMRVIACRVCGGGRLKPESLSYRVGNTGTYEGDQSIADLVQMDLRSLVQWLEDLDLEGRQEIIGGPVVKEIRERVGFLVDVGLDYLTLDRPARTLSGGESQRIRLATQIGTQLTGVLYVLDEPSIGLHPRDNTKLIDSLQSLRDLGNSVLVVEHDRETIEAADFVLDLGPGAGEYGGELLAAGPPEVISTPSGDGLPLSLTTAYLAGLRAIPTPASGERREGSGHEIVLEGARGHNLQDVTFRLPLGTLTCVTGVSGSGKSTLINHTLRPALAQHFHNSQTVPLPYDDLKGLEHVDKVIAIDQSPIGRTPRSNPATYTGLFGLIRELFARMGEAEIRGYKPGRFSFNVKGGRCETCKGAGIMKLEMNFLPDVYVECETCKGRRYNAETLHVRFKGLNIAEVLDLPVSEALEVFANQPRIARKLKTLDAVGLGYLRLGQAATTLSGGEAQRVKLSKELSRPGTGNTLYILDEPTTGLHFEDVRHLLLVLQALVDKGNTVLVIEHNMDVAKQADWVVDLGPDGGAGGGQILFAGTPEALAEADTPTAPFLREELERAAEASGEPLPFREIDLDALSKGGGKGDDDGEDVEEDEPEEVEA
ncbi:excinuclease ABC subunit UvrA [Rubricoccus marinus]|uniref:UvrABC system protein A n=1 Tax=Rubricoccus marinus TaxID=716817 RepID=A0A259TVQ2_9BACT|nr:excinuclease ABC subunit UvrA [Rubricoccus marinus]OZC01628.1 excinuclease ABC subunit A [Rubricoccus marinus]